MTNGQTHRKIDRSTDGRANIQKGRQMDEQTDRHKSFIDMRYYTEQYSKSNGLELNRIKSNQIDLK